MTTPVLRYACQTRPQNPTYISLDAKSIACDNDGSTVYSTPNMSFVPEPHNGTEELRACADSRFGTANCFQWPQLYSNEYHYAVCVRRKEHYPTLDPLSWAWYRPTMEDFQPLTHTASQVGKLKQEKAIGVASLSRIASERYKEWKNTHGDKQDIASRMLKSLQHDVMLLLNHPLTFRDIVVFITQAQRYFLDILAFLDYVQYVQPCVAYPSGSALPVQSHWMGCFTPDTDICDNLFHAGVPVWLIRSHHMITSQTIIETHVRFTFPDEITRSMYSEGGQTVRPFDCLYCGLGGSSRHRHTQHAYTGSGGSNPSFSQPSSQITSQVDKVPNQAQSRRAAQKERARPQSGTNMGGCNKWEELDLPEMPSYFVVWVNAMKRVDKDPTRVKKGLVDQGYRVPEPALLILGQSPEWRKLFMMNWLTLRPLWISHLDHDPPARFPTPQQWREILHGVPAKEQLETASTNSKAHSTAKSRKLAVLEIFGEVAAAFTQGSTFAPKEDVEWRGKYIKIETLSNPPPRLIKAFLWEVYKIGWRYELCALDQVLNPRLWAEHQMEQVSLLHTIFPGSVGLVLWSEPLPTAAGDFGLTDSYPDNERVLRSFCLLLSTWPNAHPSFSYIRFKEGVKHIQAFKVMSQACHFYIQTFFDHFGRPPLLPHRFLLEYHN